MNKIYSINGPVVKVRNTNEFSMLEMVYVGNKRLIGEVISIDDEFTTIQVYEVTTGMKIGESRLYNRSSDVRCIGTGYYFKHI